MVQLGRLLSEMFAAGSEPKGQFHGREERYLDTAPTGHSAELAAVKQVFGMNKLGQRQGICPGMGRSGRCGGRIDG